MHPRSSLRLVGVRACALAAVATTSGVLGHVHAGGSAPGLAQVLGLWLAASALSAGFLIRQVGWVRIVALLLGEQLLVHAGSMWVAVHSGSSMPAMANMPGMAGMSGMPGMHSMSPIPSPSMIAAHALAAAVAGLWLWRGECALWALLALAGASVRVLWRRVVIRPLRAMPALRVALDVRSTWGLRIAREVQRRGPPRLAAL